MSLDGRPRPRPLSPYLTICGRTMMMSIMHRTAGAALYLGTLLLVWWLIAMAEGPTSYASNRGSQGTARAISYRIGLRSRGRRLCCCSRLRRRSAGGRSVAASGALRHLACACRDAGHLQGLRPRQLASGARVGPQQLFSAAVTIGTAYAVLKIGAPI
jgi:hypothetical protein